MAGGVDGYTNGATDGQDVARKFGLKAGLAKMLKGGVIMDVVNAEQVILGPCRKTSFRGLTRSGTNSRGCWRLCGHGARAGACRYSSTRRRGKDVRSTFDQGDPRCRHNTRHGEGSDRTFCRMSSMSISPVCVSRWLMIHFE